MFNDFRMIILTIDLNIVMKCQEEVLFFNIDKVNFFLIIFYFFIIINFFKMNTSELSEQGIS